MRQTFLKTKTVFFAAAALLVAAVCVFTFLLMKPAFAEELDVYVQADAAQARVEESAAAYEEAMQSLEKIEEEIAENEVRLAQLAEKIPAIQQESDQAIVYLYKAQREGGSVFVLLLSSGSLREFLVNLDYMTAVYNDKMNSVSQLRAMKAEVDEIVASLETKRVQVAEEAENARKALEEAQELRAAAQAAAQAARQAEEEAAEAARQAAEEEEEQRRQSGDEGTGEDGELTSGDVSADPGSDGADWSTDKATFVAAWAGRIDSYLSGSPLSGYGANFAAAAWDYGVDPRFSPAISCVESSKGRYCFRNHNAWGWGSVDWDSWEEAIDSHVRGLSRGYGYTVTIPGAQKYCPPNWEFWYSRVCAEMALI